VPRCAHAFVGSCLVAIVVAAFAFFLRIDKVNYDVGPPS